jgi:hypothetical protein
MHLGCERAWLAGLSLVAVLTACEAAQQAAPADEGPSSTANDRRRGTPTAEIDAGTSTRATKPPGSEARALCPTCTAQPGGDTSDLGGQPACRGTVIARERVTLAEARAQGFDPDAIHALVLAQDRFEAHVRWVEPLAAEPTRIRIELAGEQTATIHRFQDAEDPWHPDNPPCHDGDYLSVDVRISIATEDGRVSGSFIAAAGPGEFGGYMLHHEQPGGLVSVGAMGDGSQFRGTLPLGPSPADAPFLEAWLRILTGPEFEPRVDLSLYLVHYEQDGGDRLRKIDDFAELLPADGCHTVRYPHTGPIFNSECHDPRFGEGCCVLTWLLFAPGGEDAGAQ